MSSLAFFQGLLAQERDIFTKVVGAVPEDGLEYRPDSRSRCSRDLIEHLIGHSLDMAELIDDGVIHHRNQVPFESVADAVSQLDDSFAGLVAKLEALDEEAWRASAKFLAGDHLIMEGSREQLAWLFLLDAVHHRGQLSTHLRPTGAKVPSIYGPSADETMTH